MQDAIGNSYLGPPLSSTSTGLPKLETQPIQSIRLVSVTATNAVLFEDRSTPDCGQQVDGTDTLILSPADGRGFTIDMTAIDANGDRQVSDGLAGSQFVRNLENITTSGGADTITDFNTDHSGLLGDSNPTNDVFIYLSLFCDRVRDLRADLADDRILNQSNAGALDYANTVRFQPGDSLTFQRASKTSFTADNTGVACFTEGTLTLTPHGEAPTETLRPGDLVMTRDNRVQPLAGRHQVILACGPPSESFFPGPHAVRSLREAEYRELLSIFPMLTKVWTKNEVSHLYGAKARPFLTRSGLPKKIGAFAMA